LFEVIFIFNIPLARKAYVNLNTLSFSKPPSALPATLLTVSSGKPAEERQTQQHRQRATYQHEPILSRYLIHDFN